MTSETREAVPTIAELLRARSRAFRELGKTQKTDQLRCFYEGIADGYSSAAEIVAEAALLPQTPAAGSATEPGPLDGWARRLFPDRLPADVLSGVTELSNAIEIELFGLLMNNQIEGRTIAASIEIAEAILSKLGTPPVDSSPAFAKHHEAMIEEVGPQITADLQSQALTAKRLRLGLPVDSSLRDGWSDADVERVARAIATAHGVDPDDDAPLSQICGPRNEPLPWWTFYEEDASAALEAIGAPSEGPRFDIVADFSTGSRAIASADTLEEAMAKTAEAEASGEFPHVYWNDNRPDGEDESAPSEVKG